LKRRRALRFSVFLCNSYGVKEKRNTLSVLLNKRVDGVVLLSGYHRVGNEPARPTVRCRSSTISVHEMSVPSVVPDDRGGAELNWTSHALGDAVGFINGPCSYEATHLRLEGYRKALEASGIRFFALGS